MVVYVCVYYRFSVKHIVYYVVRRTITDKGIGNGISLLIMVGIIARLPFALSAEFVSKVAKRKRRSYYFPYRTISIISCRVDFYFISTRHTQIPVQYAKELSVINNMAVKDNIYRLK